MREQESRWSLEHTGNRVLLAVVIGLVVGLLGSSALVFLLTAGVAYWLLTVLRRR